MKSRVTYTKPLPKNNSVNRKETHPSRLSQIALQSLTLHIMEEGAQEATNAVEKKRYEREANKAKQKIKEFQGTGSIDEKRVGMKAAAKRSIKPISRAVCTATLKESVPGRLEHLKRSVAGAKKGKKR
jgi:hypothetical protein